MRPFSHYLDSYSSGADDWKPPRPEPTPVRAWLRPTLPDLAGGLMTLDERPADGAWAMTVEDGIHNDELFGELDGLLQIAAEREVPEVYVWSVSDRTFQRHSPANGGSTETSVTGTE